MVGSLIRVGWGMPIKLLFLTVMLLSIYRKTKWGTSISVTMLHRGKAAFRVYPPNKHELSTASQHSTINKHSKNTGTKTHA